MRGNLKRILIFTGLDSSQALLRLGRCHESQSVEYLQSLPQTEITFGKYRATNRVDKYEYCRPEDCPGGRSSSTLPADCPEFIAAIQFNRRLQFSRLPRQEEARIKYPTANSDKIAPRPRERMLASHTRERTLADAFSHTLSSCICVTEVKFHQHLPQG